MDNVKHNIPQSLLKQAIPVSWVRLVNAGHDGAGTTGLKSVYESGNDSKSAMHLVPGLAAVVLTRGGSSFNKTVIFPLSAVSEMYVAPGTSD